MSTVKLYWNIENKKYKTIIFFIKILMTKCPNVIVQAITVTWVVTLSPHTNC